MLLIGILIEILSSADLTQCDHWRRRFLRSTSDNAETSEIPLPPLEVQKEIVAEIEGYQKVIDGARAVLDHYRPHIPIHPDWPMVELADD